MEDDVNAEASTSKTTTAAPSTMATSSSSSADAGPALLGPIRDLPTFSDAMSRSSSSGSQIASPEEAFFTPRGGSPFFPTAMLGLPTGMSTPAPTEGPRHPSPSASSSSSRSVSPSGLLRNNSSVPSRSSTNSEAKSDSSESSSKTETASIATITQPPRVSSSPMPSPLSAPPAMEDGEETQQQDVGSDTAAPAASGEPASIPAPAAMSSSWPARLRQGLIDEGLSEAAATAEQELLVGKTEPEVVSALAAVEMSDRQISTSSDISRTPSTSTTGSLTTQSQVSTETSPSTVLSEPDDLKTVGPDSSNDQTPPTIHPERDLQSKLRRYHALLELVETEQSYARDLSALVHVYMDSLHLQQYFEDHPARIDVVIRNSPQLAQSHAEIAMDLERILEENGVGPGDAGSESDKALSAGIDAAVVAVGSYFAKLDDRLLLYQEFCARHAEALAVIREAEKRHNGEDFAAFERLCGNILRSRPSTSRQTSTNDLARQYQARSGSSTPAKGLGTSPAALGPLTSLSSSGDTSSGDSSFTSRPGGRLTFADLLIKPIQRLCLYPLVLHTLLKHTGPDDSGREELEAALVTVRRVADEVDAAGRSREQLLLASLIASRVEPHAMITQAALSSFGFVSLSGTLDVLYHHSTFSPLVAPLRFRFLGLFLYQEGLLIVKVRKSGGYEPLHWFPLRDAKLSSVEEEEGVLPHAFRLSVKGQHHFELAASSSRERALWVDKLAAAMAADALEASTTLPPVIADHPPVSSRFPSNLPYIPGMSPSAIQADRDPLSDFLSHQSTSSNSTSSPEVLVRYASLPQRAVVDRGMIFSDSILGARAITHKDGTFTPGGSITKSSAGSGSTTPGATTPVAGLTAWPAGTMTGSTSSLSAAVGAAMGLARVAKRTSRQSMSSNVFELAAHQHLAKEEQRIAKEEEMEAAAAAAASGVTERKRGSRPSLRPQSMLGTWGGSSSSAPSPSTTPGAVQAPMFFGSHSASSSAGGSTGALLDSPPATPFTSIAPQKSGESISRPTSPNKGSSLLRRRRSNLALAGSGAGSALRDAFSGTWSSRRARSQTADVVVGGGADRSSPSQPVSPLSPMFALDGSNELGVVRTASGREGAGIADASALPPRPPSALRRALTGMSGKRDRSKSVTDLRPVTAGASALSSESPTRKAFESPERETLPPQPQAQSQPTRPSVGGQHRRRTSSTFGNMLGLMGPPLESLRRSATGSSSSPDGGSRRWGTRSASASRRGSVVEEAAVQQAQQVQQQPAAVLSGAPPSRHSISLSPRGREAMQATLPASFTARNRSQPALMSTSSPRQLSVIEGSSEGNNGSGGDEAEVGPEKKTFARSSTDTELTPGTVKGRKSRPTTPRSSSSPMQSQQTTPRSGNRLSLFGSELLMSMSNAVSGRASSSHGPRFPSSSSTSSSAASSTWSRSNPNSRVHSRRSSAGSVTAAAIATPPSVADASSASRSTTSVTTSLPSSATSSPAPSPSTSTPSTFLARTFDQQRRSSRLSALFAPLSPPAVTTSGGAAWPTGSMSRGESASADSSAASIVASQATGSSTPPHAAAASTRRASEDGGGDSSARLHSPLALPLAPGKEYGLPSPLAEQEETENPFNALAFPTSGGNQEEAKEEQKDGENEKEKKQNAADPTDS